ncbi:MAG: hypothetical protein ACJ8AI_15115, partial [Rhodopila sp.]
MDDFPVVAEWLRTQVSHPRMSHPGATLQRWRIFNAILHRSPQFRRRPSDVASQSSGLIALTPGPTKRPRRERKMSMTRTSRLASSVLALSLAILPA